MSLRLKKFFCDFLLKMESMQDEGPLRFELRTLPLLIT